MLPTSGPSRHPWREIAETPRPRIVHCCYLTTHFNSWVGVSTIRPKENTEIFGEDIGESKAKYRKIVRAGIAKWISDFQRGAIEINTVDDLRKLIELDLRLQREDP